MHSFAGLIRMKHTLSKHLIQVNCDASNEVVRTIVFVIALKKHQTQTKVGCPPSMPSAHLNLNPVIALDDGESVVFVPFGAFATFLMGFRAPLLSHGRIRLQKNDAVRVIFAEEVHCKWKGWRQGRKGRGKKFEITS